jgi:hypothetical protein
MGMYRRLLELGPLEEKHVTQRLDPALTNKRHRIAIPFLLGLKPVGDPMSLHHIGMTVGT